MFKGGTSQLPYEEVSSRLFSLLITIWIWALAVLICVGLAEILWAFPDLNLLFGSNLVLPILASTLGFLIVVMKTKIIDKLDLGGWRSTSFFTIFGIGFVSLAVWCAVFLIN